MSYRVGHGHDLHRLQQGGNLILGGITVSTEMSPVAHSDGDVVLHALTDALLGTIQAGDIGDAFPNTDNHWKDASSRQFVEHALGLVRAAGYEVVNADVLIQTEKPKLAPFKTQIAAAVSALLNAPANVKAGTNEGCDAIGRGEAIAATVVVLVRNRA